MALFGKSMRNRPKPLISIAHPDFRDELAADVERPPAA
jgi:acyl-CoA hydrolase